MILRKHYQIETIQNEVEKCLMRQQEHEILSRYIRYREEHRKRRENQLSSTQTISRIQIQLPNGGKKTLTSEQLKLSIEQHCQGLTHTDHGYESFS